MKPRSSFAVLVIVFILLSGLSCTAREKSPPVLSQAALSASETKSPLLKTSQDWTPPVFPGAVIDQEINSNMTAVATTPQALEETANNCFGFAVHNPVFYAYSSEAKIQDVMDFYSEQMASQGWKRIVIYPADSSLPRLGWQQGMGGRLVASLMVMQMQDNRTVIYLTVAETNSPQTIIEE